MAVLGVPAQDEESGDSGDSGCSSRARAGISRSQASSTTFQDQVDYRLDYPVYIQLLPDSVIYAALQPDDSSRRTVTTLGREVLEEALTQAVEQG